MGRVLWGEFNVGQLGLVLGRVVMIPTYCNVMVCAYGHRRKPRYDLKKNAFGAGPKRALGVVN